MKTVRPAEPDFVPGEVLVKFREDVSEKRKDNLHAKNGSKKLKEYKGLRLHRLKLHEQDDVKKAVARYKEEPDVEYAEPNYIVKHKATPNDPSFSTLWGIAKIAAEGAWDKTTGSPSVVVAIIDTGTDYNHADLKSNIWVNDKDVSNGSDEDGNGYVDDIHGINAITGTGNPMDDHGHGTHVAGTIGAVGNNGIGVAGVNWSVKMIPCKFLDSNGSGSVADAVECLLYVKALKDRGVNIVATNNSWGGGGYSQALYDAINAQRDILFVAAAGNDNANIDVAPFYPAGYELPNIISVAATDSNDQPATFSNYGKHAVDVAAPGVTILSTLPAQNYFGITGGYGYLSGTSMATPHVTGLAALLKAQEPSRDWRAVKNLILSGGTDTLSLARKTLTGKRIDAADSLTCVDRPMLVPDGPSSITSGSTYTVSALSINCGTSLGPVTVQTEGGASIELKDDGTGLDAAAGDGTFTGTWTAGALPTMLTFSSPAGSRSLSFPPLQASWYIADARPSVLYFQPLTASGGFPPYAWSVTDGALPAGLALDSSTGIISGRSDDLGDHTFTAQVTDSRGQTFSVAVTLRVVDEQVDQLWGRTFQGAGDAGAIAVANDAAGNSYVTGYVVNGTTRDLLLMKYDQAGKLLWTRTYDGDGRDETGQSIVLDGAGHLYIGGQSSIPGLFYYDNLLVKYDTSGNLLWGRHWKEVTATYRSNGLRGVTVDASGNVYTSGVVTGSGLRDLAQLAKYDALGNTLWTRVLDNWDNATYANALVVNSSGSIYFGGATSRVWNVFPDGSRTFAYNSLLVKCDSTGNIVWTKEQREGDWYFIEGLALDSAENIYSTAWVAGSTAYGVTMKLDPSGTTSWKRSTTGNRFWPSGIAIANGKVYVGGTKDGAVIGRNDYQLVQYDLLGNEGWTKSLASQGYGGAYGVAADSAGVSLVGAFKDSAYGAITARYGEIHADDLSITGLSGTLNGDLLSYTMKVKNSGSGAPDPSVGLYFSSDATPTTNGPRIALIDAGSVPGGSEKTLSGTVIVPATTATGTYRLVALADPDQAVLETDETNNAAIGNEVSFTSNTPCDLQIAAVSGTIAAGTLTYSITIKNTGNLTAPPSWTGLNLAGFSSLQPVPGGAAPPTAQYPVTTLATPMLSPGQQVVLTGSVAVPSAVPPHSYLVAAAADASLEVAEFDEGNNRATGNMVSYINDLSVTELSGTVSGGMLTYSLKVGNAGTAVATTSVGVYFSTDAVPSGADYTAALVGITVPGGAEQVVSGTVPVPNSLPTGTYYLVALADPGNVVLETDESNNGAVGGTFSVKTDLQVNSVTGSVSTGKLYYWITVKNNGDISTAPCSTAVYLSTDGVSMPAQGLVTTVSTPALLPGAQTVLTGNVTVANSFYSGSYYVAALADSSNVVTESVENNNGAFGNSISLANDFSITDFSATLKAGVLSYSVTVANDGNGSPSPTVALSFSGDATASADDYLITALTVQGLSGKTQRVISGSVTLPSTIPSGTYYVTAFADPKNELGETLETNNTAVLAPITVTNDLQIGAVSGTIAQGKLSYSVTVKNVGTIPSAAGITSLYLSGDATASPADYFVSALTTAAIPAGGEKLLTGTVTVPTSIPPGSYYVAAYADSTNASPESDEGNNGGVGDRVILANDLSVGTLSGSLSGGMLSYTVTVGNAGTGIVNTTVPLYFSTDQTASTSDYLITTLTVNALAAGTEKVLSGTVSVPGTIPSGTYYLAALADPANALIETDKSNNDAIGTQFALNTDVQVGALSGSIVGGKLSYSITLSNAGNIATPAFTTNLNLASTPSGGAPSYTVTTLNISAIAAGGQKVLSGSVAVPITTPPGTYYVVAQADSADVVTESVETNNIGSGNSVVLANDLSISALSGTLSGGVLSYSVVVKNAGTGSVNASVPLYFSPDATASTSDYQLVSLTVSGLAAGTEKTYTGSVSVPGTIPSGSYYLTAFADAGNAVAETDENNNGFVSSLFSVNSDLQVGAVNCSIAGGKLTYSVTLNNAGNIAAATSSTELIFASTPSGGSPSYTVTTLTTPAIAAGVQKVLSGTVSVPTTIPAGSYYLVAEADSTDAVKESVETNNLGSGNSILLANDLSVSALSGTLSGGVLSYSVVVKNAGSGSVNASVPLYFSPDATASASDYQLVSLTVSGLAAGTEKIYTGSVSVPGTIPSGSYYLTAFADAGNAVAETDETNNGFVSSQFSVNSDLQVGALSGSIAGGKLSYSVTLNNNGNITAGASSTALILASSPSGGAPSYTVTTVSTSTIGAAGQKVLSGSVAVPTTIPPGTYYLVAQADSADAVKESVETNNQGSGNSVVLANDLSISALSGSFSAGVLSYSVTVKNAGTGSVNASVPLYFSPNLYFAPNHTPSANDYQLVSLTLSGLAAGSEKTFTGTVTVPGTIPSGTYFLAAIADPSNAVVETDETNNALTANQFTVNSDLQVGTVSGTLAAGKLTYSVTLNNSGNLGSVPFSVPLALSTSPSGGAPSYLVSTLSCSSIVAGGQRVLTGSVTIPATIPPGSYYVVATADSTDVVKESVEGNNIGVGNGVVLTNDLSIGTLSGSVSGGALSYSVTVRNSGTGIVNTTVPVYFSGDATASAGDYQVATVTVSNLAAGTEKTFTGTVTVPGTLPSGTYYLAALADPGNAVAETDESNNGYVATQLTVYNDLQITAVSGTVAAGKLTYSVTVKNAGTIAAAGAMTGVYLSTDAVASLSDYEAAAVSIPSLAAGAEKVLSGTVTLSSTIPAGTFYVAAIADKTNVVQEQIETNNSLAGNTVTK